MILDLFLMSVILFIAVAIVHSSSLLTSVILATAMSVLCALLYVVMAAPDVALTEASIGACVTTCFLLATLKYLNKDTDKLKIDYLAIGICIILFVAIVCHSLELHEYGAVDSLTNGGAVAYYKSNFGKDTGLLSIVNSILASYRGFDTFGETLVIFIAGVSLLLILGKKNQEKKDEK